MVAHGNVLFMSNNEPIAVALTWTLLVLSQLPDLRQALRSEPDQVSPGTASSMAVSLLDSVISESLRLLTPNAMMSRVTTRPGSLNGVSLPERCEVVLCPLLAHRDPEVFTRPNEFLPARWQGAKPSPFEYFPFGAGGHACVGRALALQVLKATLARLIREYEIVLADDQEMDWQINIIFMPGSDPIMKLHSPGAAGVKAGRLLGPIRDLIGL
jgi:cytochrome P450